MKLRIVVSLGLLLTVWPALGQRNSFDGLTNSLDQLYRLSNAKTFSIGPDNLTG